MPNTFIKNRGKGLILGELLKIIFETFILTPCASKSLTVVHVPLTVCYALPITHSNLAHISCLLGTVYRVLGLIPAVSHACHVRTCVSMEMCGDPGTCWLPGIIGALILTRPSCTRYQCLYYQNSSVLYYCKHQFCFITSPCPTIAWSLSCYILANCHILHKRMYDVRSNIGSFHNLPKNSPVLSNKTLHQKLVQISKRRYYVKLSFKANTCMKDWYFNSLELLPALHIP